MLAALGIPVLFKQDTYGQPIVENAPDNSGVQYVQTNDGWIVNLPPIQMQQTQGPQYMDISENGRNFIKNEEGYGHNGNVYQDSAGKWTIGYGHKVVPGEPYYPYGTVRWIDLPTASYLFNEDVEARGADFVRGYVGVPLTQPQFDALTSFVYNIGSGNFLTSTLLRKLNLRDYQGAANEFPRWIYAGGKKDPVLIARRRREQQYFLGQGPYVT